MLSDAEISAELDKLKKKRRIYTPLKYFRGLRTKKEIKQRFERIVSGIVNESNYSAFQTDKKVKTKQSTYTKSFFEMYPGATSMKKKSELTGIPLYILEKVFNKGMAAWRTGHRPGATQQQWGYARVHSFIMLGCTAYTADSTLRKEAISKMKAKDVKSWETRKPLCIRKK